MFVHTDLKAGSREEPANSEVTVGRRPSKKHSSETTQSTIFPELHKCKSYIPKTHISLCSQSLKNDILNGRLCNRDTVGANV